jgi:hypothetical protein
MRKQGGARALNTHNLASIAKAKGQVAANGLAGQVAANASWQRSKQKVVRGQVAANGT